MYSNKRRRSDYMQPRRSSLQVNLSFVSNLSDHSDSEVNNIVSKQEILDKNVQRLKEAILNKTREIFDNQNDFCQMTATILGHADESDQNDQNESNSQEKKQRSESVFTKDSDDCTTTVIHKPKNDASPILGGSQRSYSSTILSPRKTRSSKKTSQSSEETFVGHPVTCSTFRIEPSTVLTKSNVTKKPSSPFETPRTSKPVIKDIRSCYIPLDKIDGYECVNKSKNLKQVSMELTTVQGNSILVEQIKESDKVAASTGRRRESEENCNSARTSLEVRTSLDPLSSDRASDAKKEDSLNKTKSSTWFHPALVGSGSISRKKSLSVHEPKNECKTQSERSSLKVNTSVGSRASINCSVVEGTPCPVTRSTLLRTQSRFTTMIRKELSGSSGPKVDSYNTTKHPRNCTIDVEAGPSTSFNRLEDTIVLDNTLKGPIIEDSSDDISEPESHLPPAERIIEDSSDDEMSDEENNLTLRGKPRKRKLFTQLNNSGLITLSPMENIEPSPKPKTPVRKVKRKPHKILKDKDYKKKEGEKTQTQKRTASKSRVKFPKILNEDKEKKKKRKILSKKIIVKKKVNPDILRVLSEVEEEHPNNLEQGRDSLNDFMDNKRIVTKSRHHNKSIYIVTTGLCNGDRDIVKEAVKKIGGAKIESSVTRQTTHVVTAGVRTINLLRGIIRGCWLISLTWVRDSVVTRKWLDPQNYEIDHFSKAVQENRRDREIFGRSYVPELFATCGLIYVDNSTAPPREILKELIKTAGGRIIEDPQKAKIIIGPGRLREIWVLDSITTGELQPLDQYQR